MVQSGEPLLDGGGDGPQDEDQGQVHPPEEGAPQHASLLVKAWYKAGDGVVGFVRPRNCEKLLPPSSSHIRHVETKDEGEGNHVKECIEVFDYAFKQPETEKNMRQK